MEEYENNTQNGLNEAVEAPQSDLETNETDNSLVNVSETVSDATEKESDASTEAAEAPQSDLETNETGNSPVNVSETVSDAAEKEPDTRTKAEKLNDKADKLAARLKKLRKEARDAEKAEKQAAEQAEHDKFVSEAVEVWQMVTDDEFSLSFGSGMRVRDYLEKHLKDYRNYKASRNQKEGV